jgi:DnaJ-class molecular chaperone
MALNACAANARQFKRHGDDVHATVDVGLKAALLGTASIHVPTLDGKGIDLPLKGVTQVCGRGAETHWPR